MGSPELTDTEKRAYSAIRERAKKDPIDGNFLPWQERGQRGLMSLPLAGELFRQIFLLTGTYPIDKSPAIPEIESIEDFLAKERTKEPKLRFEAETQKDVLDKRYEYALKSMDLLSFNIWEKLTDEEKPEPNYTHSDYFKERYSKEMGIGNNNGILTLNYYYGGQKDGLLTINYNVQIQNPKARVYFRAEIKKDGFFTIDRTQNNLENREYIQSSEMHCEISPSRVCLPENTDVVIRELEEALVRLYLNNPTKETLEPTPKPNQENP